MAADGVVVIDTRLDTTSIKTGVSDMKQSFDGLSGKVKQISNSITSFFSKSSAKTVKTVKTDNAKINAILDDTAKSAKQKASLIASLYKKEGYSASDAFTKAWTHIERDSSNTSARVKKHIRGIGNQSNKTSNDMQRDFSVGFSNVTSSVSTKLKKIGLLIGSVFAIRKLIQFGKESIELGSDLAEVQNVVDVTFTTMSDRVNEFAKNAMTTAGLSETMAKQYVGTFGAMAKSFDFSESQAYDMSTALTQLTGDVASFYNISQDLAYTKLKSVFTGETETLKDLGVVMTQTALDQYALANGYGKTTSAMTEQEKVALRLKFVTEQLSAASGDFARTSGSWANQVRVMQLQLQSLKATVGQGLINIFTPVIRVINILLGKLTTLANAFKSFTELITGKKSSGSTGSGAGLIGDASGVQDTADAYGQAADSASNLADSTEDVAKATKDATKAANGYLSPLDEINKYSSQTISSSPATGIGNTSGGNFPATAAGNVDYGSLAEGETALDKISDSAKKLADLLRKLWKPFQDAWKKEGKNTINAAQIALSELKTLAKDVGKSIVEVWTNGTGTQMLTTMLQIGQNVLKTIGNIASGFTKAWNKNNVGTTIIQHMADALLVIMQFVEKIAADAEVWASNLDFYPLLESISNLTGTFAPIIETIGNVLEWIYQNVVLPMLTWIIGTGLPLAINLVSDLLGFFSEHQSIIEAFGAALLGAFAAEKIATLVTSIGGSISTIILYGKGLIALITGSGGIIGGIKAIATAIGSGGILAIAIGAAIAVGVLLYKNWGTICRWAKKVKEIAINSFSALSNWLETVFSTDWTKQFGIFGNILNAFFKDVENVVKSVKKIFSGLIKTVTGVFAGDWKKAWEGVKEIFSGIWDGLSTIVKNPLNIIIAGFNTILGIINGLISQINGIKFRVTIPPWFPVVGGRSWGFDGFGIPNIGTIPYLAKGAVIPPRSEFMAVLGDQKSGTNIETPEKLLRQIFREEFGSVRQNQNTGNNVYKVSVEVSGRKLLDFVIDEGELRQKRNGGKNPFALGGT